MKYLVLSYDLDQQQTAHDRVSATTREAAIKQIGELRPSFIPITTHTAQELILMARCLAAATPADLAEELATLEANALHQAR